MGDLIVMSRAKPLPPREPTASAQILFFTGVRYYRMGEDAGAKPAAVLAGAKAIAAKRRRAPTMRRHAGTFAPVALEASV